jgi:hypothetical protein
MTPCDRLPGIFQHGGILSYEQRQLRGIKEPEDPHYWGGEGKKDELAKYVVCAFMTPWWMCRKRTEELAILTLAAESICIRPGVCFCPDNSAYSQYPSAEILQSKGIQAFDACFQNSVTYQAGSSEVFVPDIVPLSDLRGILFCDSIAADYWIPVVNEAYAQAEYQAALPPEPIATAPGSLAPFRFPGDWSATRRIRR